jgi:hypothetical protein
MAIPRSGFVLGAEADKQAPKLPIIQLLETKEIDTRAGTTIAPVLEVVSWTRPPAGLNGTHEGPQRRGGSAAGAGDTELDDEIPF